MKINSNTKISKIIKHNRDAIDVIASINPHFKKLKNPILRKVLAPRVSIADAARIGKCEIDVMLNALSEIGFEIDRTISKSTEKETVDSKIFEDKIKEGKVKTLDVRPTIEKGEDPFNFILEEIEVLDQGHILEIINSFEPIPLIKILNKKGYESLVKSSGDVVKTYFLKSDTTRSSSEDQQSRVFFLTLAELEKKRMEFAESSKEIDVRDLEMPLPMVTILNEIEELRKDQALYIHHKKVPQYLLPELEDRNVYTWITEIDDGNVKLLIHY